MERTKPTEKQSKQALAIEALSSDAYLSLNKRLLGYFGPQMTVFIANLVDKHKYAQTKGWLNEDGSFYLKHKDQQAHTGMSEYELRQCKKKMKALDLLDTYMKGLPSVEYYVINFDKLVNEFLRAIPLEFKGQGVKNLKGKGRENLTPTKEPEIKEPEEKDMNPNGFSTPMGWSNEIISLMDHWNNLPKTVSHKSDSKTYQKSCAMLQDLLDGKPLQSTNKGQPTKPLLNFASKHGINNDLLHKKWSPQEICDSLEAIVDNWQEQEGTDAKATLEEVLWNHFAKGGGFSHLLFHADKKEVPQDYYDMADKFRQAKGGQLTNGKRLDWAKQFQNLCETEDKSSEQVHIILDWYIINYDYVKVRSVEDAQEFCDYYNKIKKSMQIQKSEDDKLKQGKKPSQGVWTGRIYHDHNQPN